MVFRWRSMLIAGVFALMIAPQAAGAQDRRPPARQRQPPQSQPAAAPEPRAGTAVPRQGGRDRAEPATAAREGSRGRGSDAGSSRIAERRRQPDATPDAAPATAPSARAEDEQRQARERRRYPVGDEVRRRAVSRPWYGPSPVAGWRGYDRRYYSRNAWHWVPWGFAGMGYWGYYDPWAWGAAGPYGYGTYGYGGGSIDPGAVRLKIKPREGQVFVDGFYVGIVDEFDGVFQKLKLDEGPHTIEVRLDGHEPLSFRVYVTLDRTVTLRGELQRVP